MYKCHEDDNELELTGIDGVNAYYRCPYCNKWYVIDMRDDSIQLYKKQYEDGTTHKCGGCNKLVHVYDLQTKLDGKPICLSCEQEACMRHFTDGCHECENTKCIAHGLKTLSEVADTIEDGERYIPVKYHNLLEFIYCENGFVQFGFRRNVTYVGLGINKGLLFKRKDDK